MRVLAVLLVALVGLAGALERVQMNEVYRTLPFDDPDGGVWKQGWEIKYDEQWTAEEPLNIFVLMHSHTDPGWLKTFEDYYRSQTRSILSSTNAMCASDERNRFVYAEMSFLSLWWNDAGDNERAELKRNIANGQFEILAGGWVMNDEATVHYIAAINQYIEGHEWLRVNVGFKPRTGWAIDPFGHSPTMPFLYSKMGFNYTLIQRTHYAIKKEFALKKHLEFNWRQQWEDDDNGSDFFTHMMPFYSYDIPHTCGPDPSFDFAKLGTTTPWRTKVEGINEGNAASKAERYVDQMKKKAVLYRTGSNVLVPLGDDFRYTGSSEVRSQIDNHRMLHDYINSHVDQFHVKIRFATLSEYFDSVRDTAAKKAPSNWRDFFPIVQGDFFTYADVRQEYWSGYFISRPFWKHKGRDLESSLRAAEIANVWAGALNRQAVENAGHYDKLVAARRASSVFQHHDGMTGTAKDHVMLDYGDKLFRSLQNSYEVTENALSIVLAKVGASRPTLTLSTNLADSRSIGVKEVLKLSKRKEIDLVLYNPLLQDRTQVVHYVIDTAMAEVVTLNGALLPCQISPFFEGTNYNSEKINLHFLVTLPPLSVSRVVLRLAEHPPTASLPHAIATLNAGVSSFDSFVGIAVQEELSDVYIENERLRVNINAKSGMAESVREKGGASKRLVEDFLMYDSPQSGAYLLLPQGPAKSFVRPTNPVVLVRGPLVSFVTTLIDPVGYREMTLYNDGSLYVEVRHHTELTKDEFLRKEYVARYETDIQSEKQLFSDLQGLQMKHSYRRDDRPIGFNYYPVTAFAFIQDKNDRFTVHTRQPFGVSSMSDGQIEFIIDRRLSTDDMKGLGQSVRDNVPMEDVFHLTFEPTPRPNPHSRDFNFQSGQSNMRSLNLNYPIVTLYAKTKIAKDAAYKSRSLVSASSPLSQRNDVHLIALKERNSKENPDESIAVVMRTHLDVTPGEDFPKKVSLDFKADFSRGVQVVACQETSLTLLHNKPGRSCSADLAPMDIRTWVLKLDKRSAPDKDVDLVVPSIRGSREREEKVNAPAKKDGSIDAAILKKIEEEHEHVDGEVPEHFYNAPLLHMPKKDGKGANFIEEAQVYQVVAIYIAVIAALYFIMKLVSRKHTIVFFALLFVLASLLQLYVFLG